MLSSDNLVDEGTVLISYEGVKYVRVRAVYILVELVEPIVNVKVGFLLRLVLGRGSISRRTGKEWLIRGAMQPVTVVIVFFQVLRGSRIVRPRDIAKPGDVSGRRKVTDGCCIRLIGHILSLNAVSLALVLIL